jgi:hypothetical protein
VRADPRRKHPALAAACRACRAYPLPSALPAGCPTVLWETKCLSTCHQALMTGRMPYHFGYYRNPSDEGGVPLEYKLLPQILAASPAKYISHAVGKVRARTTGCYRTHTCTHAYQIEGPHSADFNYHY